MVVVCGGKISLVRACACMRVFANCCSGVFLGVVAVRPQHSDGTKEFFEAFCTVAFFVVCFFMLLKENNKEAEITFQSKYVMRVFAQCQQISKTLHHLPSVRKETPLCCPWVAPQNIFINKPDTDHTAVKTTLQVETIMIFHCTN